MILWKILISSFNFLQFSCSIFSVIFKDRWYFLFWVTQEIFIPDLFLYSLYTLCIFILPISVNKHFFMSIMILFNFWLLHCSYWYWFYLAPYCHILWFFSFSLDRGRFAQNLYVSFLLPFLFIHSAITLIHSCNDIQWNYTHFAEYNHLISRFSFFLKEWLSNI